jgi:hypothetical protein
MSLAGLPAYTELGKTFFVTTEPAPIEPAPIIEFGPISTHGKIVEFIPIKQLSCIFIAPNFVPL